MVFNLRTYSFASSDEGDSIPPKSFSLKELRVATHNFSHDNFLAEGGFGKVYRGRLADGSLVAVKRAKFDNQLREEQFEAEVEVGSKVSIHPNVLCLRGFCRTKKELLLVYPLMINNCLSYHLRERSDQFARPLDWATRKRIALGAARGLAHLHDQGNIKILHRRFCTSRILLNGHFEAVIGGFSAAIIKQVTGDSFLSPVEETSAYYYFDSDTICDAFRFIAPEYIFTRQCTLKNDVFAYGAVLLELISGQHPSCIVDELPLRYWAEKQVKEGQLGRVIDPNLQGNYMEGEAEQLVQLALLCTHLDPSVRPKMSEVVRMLESQFLQRDLNTRSSCSQSECDSTTYHSFPPSPSPLGIAL